MTNIRTTRSGFGFVPAPAFMLATNLFSSIVGLFKGRSARKKQEEYQRMYEEAERQRAAERTEATAGSNSIMISYAVVSIIALGAVFAFTAGSGK